MKINEFQQEASKTLKGYNQLNDEQTALADWGLGLSGECGEVTELIKHCIFHGETMNKMELAKELGDVMWYVSAICTTEGINLEDAMELNIAKLRHRHGDSFSRKASKERHDKEDKFENTEIYKELKRRICNE